MTSSRRRSAALENIAVIGCGAVANYAAEHLADSARIIVAVIEPGWEDRAREVFGGDVAIVHSISEVPELPDAVFDCAGHGALRQHGEQILRSGIDLVSVSSGALADQALFDKLMSAAQDGAAQLSVVSGAIGALDALSAASTGGLDRVVYRGRKPPKGWVGSAAEDKLELASLAEPAVHFAGSARDAALEYPQNANVAASVALAGIGFDDTSAELIADPGVTENIHEIIAEGAFGHLEFRISGRPLPGNPKSSALTAMSVVRESRNRVAPLSIR
jgi:aspartate dehydrogenase